MEIGLIGLGRWAATWPSGSAAAATRSSVTTAPRVRDVDTLEALVAALSSAPGGLGDGALRRADPGHGRRARRPAEAGDIIIDGGNSRYTDDQAHAAALAEQGIRYLDAGVSGGVWGLTEGYALMVGGDADNVAVAAADLRLAEAGRPAASCMPAR